MSSDDLVAALDSILLRYVNLPFGQAEGIECRDAILIALAAKPEPDDRDYRLNLADFGPWSQEPVAKPEPVCTCGPWQIGQLEGHLPGCPRAAKPEPTPHHPERAAKPEPELNEERLVEAFHAFTCSKRGHAAEYDRPYVEAIAAEYARLSDEGAEG